MKINNLLITAIGGDIAQATAGIIRKKLPEIKLIGTDIQNRHSGALFVDDYEGVPKANEKNYLNGIQRLIDKYKIDAILPMSEEELNVYACMGDKIGNCHIIHCGQKALEVGLDKLKTNQLLKSMGKLYPWTVTTKDGNPASLPCILKPRTGSGSKGIFIVKDAIDVEYFNKKYANSIYQQLLIPADKEITCAVYREKSGKTHVLQLLRQLIGDATGWAEVVKYKEISQLCADIANELGAFGCFNIQLINTPKGAMIFEINPRISSTVAMRDAIGFEDVVWLLNELENKTIRPKTINTNKILHKIQKVVTSTYENK